MRGTADKLPSWVHKETRAPPQFWKGDAELKRFAQATLRLYLLASLLFEIGNFIFKESP